ncbi:cytochrome c biogenesis protein CcsA [Abyssicoccus albus]|uniref:cytochrome c biogenesis protein CcsA n=1 Tax=Abyssicoccus albus TaxID=1817405 RepID=UPI00097E3451|nr:cytochrome c biogenesis protein CcsA [Abyssicoccus albus]AQL56395.1 hypothetical protein BVH56_05410 [Abyssicoccus albus]
MNPMDLLRLQELIIFIYAFSLLCLYYDFVLSHDKVQKLGIYTLGIVWFSQTIFLFMFMMQHHRLPMHSLTESFGLIAWLIMTISFIFLKWSPSDYLILFLNIFGFIFISINIFAPVKDNTIERLFMRNELLNIHVTLALLSYVLFLIAASLGVMIMIQDKKLKTNQFDKAFKRMGNLAKMHFYSRVFILIGTLMLLVSLILGLQWGIYYIGYSIFLDIKVIMSIIVFICYMLLILLSLKWYKTFSHFAKYNVGIFIILLFNFIFITMFSGFHY